MPDENKFEKLRQIRYTVPVSCGLCIYGEFPSRGSPWGTCALHRYEHKRQDSPEEGRGVSIHSSGTCSSAKPDNKKVAALGAHREFLAKK